MQGKGIARRREKTQGRIQPKEGESKSEMRKANRKIITFNITFCPMTLIPSFSLFLLLGWYSFSRIKLIVLQEESMM